MTERLLERVDGWRREGTPPLTQAELAATLGIKQPHLSRVLRGERRLSDRLLRRLRVLATEMGDTEAAALCSAILLGEVSDAA
jgi:transcriptional regulator with XRE-family HTH domain